ncbi:MAG: DUF4905 domain-containing protein [Cytophagales bacterium]
MEKLPAFSAIFNGHIWRIIPDFETQCLVIEIRNYEHRIVTFAAINLRKKAVLWQNFSLKETWWIGIEAVKCGHIYFHGYNHIQYANHLAISCLQIESQKILWERSDIIFHSIDKNQLIAQKKNQDFSHLFLTLDLKTGHTLSEFEGILNNSIEPNASVFYPIMYDAQDEAFSRLVIFLQKKLEFVVVNAVEYLEYNDFIIISFYIKEGDKLQNRLILLDKDAFLLLDLILDQNLDGIGTQTFLVLNNQLIFVKHKTELSIYDL